SVFRHQADRLVDQGQRFIELANCHKTLHEREFELRVEQFVTHDMQLLEAALQMLNPDPGIASANGQCAFVPAAGGAPLTPEVSLTICNQAVCILFSVVKIPHPKENAWRPEEGEAKRKHRIIGALCFPDGLADSFYGLSRLAL